MFMPSETSFALAHPVLPVRRPAPRPTARPVEGILAGTLVDTVTGWMAIERLGAGDEVHTIDGGLRRLQGLRRMTHRACPRVLVPGGVLGNDTALALPAGQLVFVDGAALEQMFDLPLALARVADLAGLGGIRVLEPDAHAELFQPVFAEEEIVWTAGGLRLHCPAQDVLAEGFFEILSPAQARLYALAMRNSAPGPQALAA